MVWFPPPQKKPHTEFSDQKFRAKKFSIDSIYMYVYANV